MSTEKPATARELVITWANNQGNWVRNIVSVSDEEVATLPRLQEKVEALNPQLIASRLELVRAEREHGRKAQEDPRRPPAR